MTLELFEQGSGAYIPVFLISLLITIAAYSAYPLLYAYFQNEPITAKKFRRICFLGNLVPVFFFFFLNGGSSGAPYILWTSVFSSVGKKILDRRNLLEDSDDFIETQTSDTEPEYENELPQEPIMATDPVKPQKGNLRFCKFCGSPINHDTRKCIGCGKQYFSFNSIKKNGLAYKIALLLSFLIIAFCVFSNYQYYLQNTRLVAKVAELEGAVNSHQVELEETKAKLSDFQNKYRTAFSENYDLKKEISDMKPVYSYCEKQLVATEEKRKQYHDVDCSALGEYGVSGLYTESSARSRGYSKCWCRNW